jgi:hypothetical protein
MIAVSREEKRKFLIAEISVLYRVQMTRHGRFSWAFNGATLADEAPQYLRGSAFGMFNFASGIAVLLASLIAALFLTSGRRAKLP